MVSHKKSAFHASTVDVIVTDQSDQIHHIRVSGRAEKNHHEIYKLLNVKDPLKRKIEIVGKRL